MCGLEDLQDHRDDCTYVPYLSPRLKAASRSPGSLELVPRNRSRTSVFGYPTPRGSFRANHLGRSCLEGFDRGDDRASRLAALPDEDLGSGESPRSSVVSNRSNDGSYITDVSGRIWPVRTGPTPSSARSSSV